MNKKYDRYSMLIQWSDVDDAYIVSFPEFPGCHTHGVTYEEAIKNGREVIELLVDTYEAEGQSVPAPSVFASP